MYYLKKILNNLYIVKKRIIDINDYLYVKFYPTSSKYISSVPKEKCILVFAAHCDDEILGMGGTLLLHDYYNSDITCVYFTDGCKSFLPECSEKKMKIIRMLETITVSKSFKKFDPVFLKLKSMNWSYNDELIERVNNLILEIKPDVIYILNGNDINYDHYMVNKTLNECFKCIKYDNVIRLYEVQFPLGSNKNYFVNIDCFIQEKKELLKIYESQRMMKQSFDKVLLYNRWIGKRGGECSYMEAFQEMKTDEYKVYAEHIRLDNKFQIIKSGNCLYKALKKYK